MTSVAFIPELVDPERALAVTYASAALRPGLAALFALDERLGAVVGTTTEPMIGLMRLAWWRESIEKLGQGDVPAEPVLAALATDVVGRQVGPVQVAAIEDGWAALLDGEPDAEAIARHGQARGGALFLAAGQLLGSADARLERAGTGWALADLAHRHSDSGVKAEARGQGVAALAGLFDRGWPGNVRALAALAVLARADVATEARRQGSPGRIARMLVVRLTGR